MKILVVTDEAYAVLDEILHDRMGELMITKGVTDPKTFEVEALVDQMELRETVMQGLVAAIALIDEALPKFNWKDSALDATAITLLNNVPAMVRRAHDTLKAAPTAKSTETIYICGEDGPARILLSAVSRHIDDDSFEQNFGKRNGNAEVRMTINGVDVPITQTLADIWKRFGDCVDREAKRKAVKMVTAAGLDSLAAVLQQAEQSIREKLGIWDESDD